MCFFYYKSKIQRSQKAQQNLNTLVIFKLKTLCIKVHLRLKIYDFYYIN